MKKKWPAYERAVKEWQNEREMIDGFQCQAQTFGDRCRKKAQPRPHHKAGRIGKNLMDKSKFMATCWHHHQYIHANPGEARMMGYILDEFK